MWCCSGRMSQANGTINRDCRPIRCLLAADSWSSGKHVFVAIGVSRCWYVAMSRAICLRVSESIMQVSGDPHTIRPRSFSVRPSVRPYARLMYGRVTLDCPMHLYSLFCLLFPRYFETRRNYFQSTNLTRFQLIFFSLRL